MSMTAKKWSINGLSTELGVDRRTLARKLRDAEPAGQGPNGPVYWMKDAFGLLIRPRGMWWTTEDATDTTLTGFVLFIEEHEKLEAIAREIHGDGSPLLLRRMREFLATCLWEYLATSDTDPPAPDWRPLTDAAFDRSYTDLIVRRHTLAEIAASVSKRFDAHRRRARV